MAEEISPSFFQLVKVLLVKSPSGVQQLHAAWIVELVYLFTYFIIG